MKKPVNLSLTPKAIEGLDTLAAKLRLSRSEIVEQIGRGLLSTTAFLPQSLTQRHSLPDYPAIYLVLEGDRVLYIGNTAELKMNPLRSSVLQELEAKEDNIRLCRVECSEVSLLSVIQGALIKVFQPKLNETTKRNEITVHLIIEENTEATTADLVKKKLNERLLDSEGCFLHVTDSSLSFLSGSYSYNTKISPIDNSDSELALELFQRPQDSEDNAKIKDFLRALQRFYSEQYKTSQDDNQS
ncbi:ribbon-helix-helix protein, CopG family [Trichocoleus sp. DQ-A3]|uniref:ribbon-helix-helix protein, CopG family n=1 Tax=Cyanophyceae TaxID=3028117 RepID=UPI0018EF672B|nr:ribbon-helix-helix protein, CopG family [Coleofasciculus sp. FACHB-125]